MLLVLFSILIFSVKGFSSDMSCQGVVRLPTVDPMITDLKNYFNQLAVTDEQVLGAHCKSKNAPTYLEMQKYFSSMKGKQKSKIHGVEFVSESKVLIDAFKKLTTDMGEVVPEGVQFSQVKIQESFRINPDCQNVVCAVEKIWGQELGVKLLYMITKHNFNGSELAVPKSRQYEVEEIDDVLMALEDLPPELVPLAQVNRRLALSNESPKENGMEVYADSSIELFSSWRGESSARRQYVVFHELAHNMATSKRRIDEKKDWLNLSGWEKMREEWKHDPKGCFISMYGTTDPYEDMAESISSYRYNPEELKKMCPDKYTFIKQKVFSDREFLSDKGCWKR